MDLVVLDTNIVISALIGKGSPRRILERAFAGELMICLSADILEEYVDVLSRPKFRKFPGFYAAASSTLNRLSLLAHVVEPSRRLTICGDPDDDKFLEAAIEGSANFLVTGNRKHYPKDTFHGVTIVSPSEFVQLRI